MIRIGHFVRLDKNFMHEKKNYLDRISTGLYTKRLLWKYDVGWDLLMLNEGGGALGP